MNCEFRQALGDIDRNDPDKPTASGDRAGLFIRQVRGEESFELVEICKHLDARDLGSGETQPALM